ncbi:MAG: hypothetical protein HY720_30205 [Planctomycetes bacterium]|nr:hypothetical protein [Planctomycetota bacterium]
MVLLRIDILPDEWRSVAAIDQDLVFPQGEAQTIGMHMGGGGEYEYDDSKTSVGGAQLLHRQDYTIAKKGILVWHSFVAGRGLQVRRGGWTYDVSEGYVFVYDPRKGWVTESAYRVGSAPPPLSSYDARAGFALDGSPAAWGDAQVLSSVQSDAVPVWLGLAQAAGLAKKHEVRVLPSALCFSGDGTLLARFDGRPKPADLLEVVRKGKAALAEGGENK